MSSEQIIQRIGLMRGEHGQAAGAAIFGPIGNRPQQPKQSAIH
jgi:hypothetical protein